MELICCSLEILYKPLTFKLTVQLQAGGALCVIGASSWVSILHLLLCGSARCEQMQA